MLKLQGDTFVHITTYMAYLESSLPRVGGERATSELINAIRLNAKSLQADLVKFDVPATLASLDEILRLCEESNVLCGAFTIEVGQVKSRLKAELRGRHLWIMDRTESALLDDNAVRFGQIVADVFPNIAEDINEALQCLALGRYTAAVFHHMRTMESCVKVLAAELGVENVEKEWGKLLSDIGGKIEAMPKGDKRNRWSESHTHLYHVKQAWRNDTMHPKKTYTGEEAAAITVAVRSFVTHLAGLIEQRA